MAHICEAITVSCLFDFYSYYRKKLVQNFRQSISSLHSIPLECKKYISASVHHSPLQL